VVVEGKLAFWLLGTGIWRKQEARQLQNRPALGRAEGLRKFLTLGRVVLDSRWMGAVNI
jgi:hypothetical protein